METIYIILNVMHMLLEGEIILYLDGLPYQK